MARELKVVDAERPRLERILLLKAVLQGYRSRLDEELQPLGITTAQLRVLWAVKENPQASGARVARLCSVTPQTGQALLARLEMHGWLRRRARADSDRVLVSELTVSGQRVLLKAKLIAEQLDGRLWADLGAQRLSVLDASLTKAIENLRA